MEFLSLIGFREFLSMVSLHDIFWSMAWFGFYLICIKAGVKIAREVGSASNPDGKDFWKRFKRLFYIFIPSAYASVRTVTFVTDYWPAYIVAGVVFTVIWLTFVIPSYYKGKLAA